jgi:hypothetical protein
MRFAAALVADDHWLASHQNRFRDPGNLSLDTYVLKMRET